MIILQEHSFKVYALDNLLLFPTNLYNNDGTINDKCCRTFIGQLHFDLKVNNKFENIKILAENIIDVLNNINEKFDIIMPVPSVRNDNVKKVCFDVSNKLDILMLDYVKNFYDSFIVINKYDLKGKKVLLIDDSYDTGKTLNSIYNKISDYCDSVVALTFVVKR